MKFAIVDPNDEVIVKYDSGYLMRDTIADAIAENVKFLMLRPKKQAQIRARAAAILEQTLRDLGMEAHRL